MAWSAMVHLVVAGPPCQSFGQKGDEFPEFWSQTATNIVARKYFRRRMSYVFQLAGVVQRRLGGTGPPARRARERPSFTRRMTAPAQLELVLEEREQRELDALLSGLDREKWTIS